MSAKRLAKIKSRTAIKPTKKVRAAPKPTKPKKKGKKSNKVAFDSTGFSGGRSGNDRRQGYTGPRPEDKRDTPPRSNGGRRINDPPISPIAKKKKNSGGPVFV